MKKIIRLTESDLTKIIKRVIKEQDETVQADEIVKDIDITQYCTDGRPPMWVTKILNSLSEDDRETAKKIIKNFANVVSGKSLKELIFLRKQIKDESQKAQLLNKGRMNEQLVPLVIAGISIPATLLIVIGIILLAVILFFIFRKSGKSKKSKYGCGGPGWWNDL